MNTEDKIRALFAFPTGITFGVIISALFDIAIIGYWFFLAAFLGIALVVLVLDRASNSASLSIMEAFSDRSEHELKEIKNKKLAGQHSRWPRYIFFFGTITGYLATFFWSALELLKWLS